MFCDTLHIQKTQKFSRNAWMVIYMMFKTSKTGKTNSFEVHYKQSFKSTTSSDNLCM